MLLEEKKTILLFFNVFSLFLTIFIYFLILKSLLSDFNRQAVNTLTA